MPLHSDYLNSTCHHYQHYCIFRQFIIPLKLIEGTSDAVTSDVEHTFIGFAIDYAETYNYLVIKYLESFSSDTNWSDKVEYCEKCGLYLLKNETEYKNCIKMPGEIMEQILTEEDEIYSEYHFSRKIYPRLDPLIKKAKDSADTRTADELKKINQWFQHYNKARNTMTSQEELLSLCSDEDDSIRRLIAQNSHSSIEVLEKLAKDSNSQVRKCVAGHPNLTTKMLIKMADDPSEDVRRRIVSHPKAPKNVLARLINDSDAQVIASNPLSSLEFLISLSFSHDSDIRSMVAGNPASNEEILEKLAKDMHWYVRFKVSENPSTSLKILEELSCDKDNRVIEGVLKNKFIPLKTLRKIMMFDKHNTSFRLVLHPNVSQDLLLQILKKEKMFGSIVTSMVLRHHKIKDEILYDLSANDAYKDDIILNPNVGLKTLKKLAKDNSLIISWKAEQKIKELSCRTDSLRK